MRAEGHAPTGPSLIVRMLLAFIGLALAMGLMWLSASVHLERACVVMDTPYLPLCTERMGDAQQQVDLRKRLAGNPGDSGAWIQLANLEQSDRGKALLRASSSLAPTEPNVLMWRAGQALSNGQMPEAVELLVQLIEFRGKQEAANALARILASDGGVALLRPHLGTANRWSPRVLASLTSLKLPLASALPLLAEATAKGMITTQTTHQYIRALRDAGLWGDAYGLWLVQQKVPTPLLHNGRFDQPFQPDGFDWEVTPALPSRAGAVISLRSSGSRGQVLDIQFTGRPLVIPIIRQYVFAPPGKYILRGQYMGSRLRMEDGLAWTARCTNSGSPALSGRSEGLQDTTGAWKSFQFPISIPSNCGLVFSLQLETVMPSAATSGAKGVAAFDALELLPQRL